MAPERLARNPIGVRVEQRPCELDCEEWLPPDVSCSRRSVGPRNAVRKARPQNVIQGGHVERGHGQPINAREVAPPARADRLRTGSSGSQRARRRWRRFGAVRTAARSPWADPATAGRRWRGGRARSCEFYEHVQRRRGHGSLLERARARVDTKQRHVQGALLRRRKRLITLSSTRAKRSPRPAYGRSVSAELGRHDMTVNDAAARATAACQIVVFPIPGSPRITSAGGTRSGGVRTARRPRARRLRRSRLQRSAAPSMCPHFRRCASNGRASPAPTRRAKSPDPAHAKRRGPPRCRPAHPSACSLYRRPGR